MRKTVCSILIFLIAVDDDLATAAAQDSVPPNIIFLLIDDLGFGDLSCYSDDTLCTTPHIDRLANDGIRFTQFYVNSPICSASRSAFLTGRYPPRNGIHGHLNSRRGNAALGQDDFLSPQSPSLPRILQQAGYATGHFGKWHLGGGRDVDDAPRPAEYGFAESLVGAEGLGDRILPNEYGRLSQMSAQLGHGRIRFVELHQVTRMYMNRALTFIKAAQGQPFYVQIWMTDVHTPYHPAPQVLNEINELFPERTEQEQRFIATLRELDRQVGQFADAVDELGLAESTLILLASDNGPDPNAPGSTADFHGGKWSLYEGGIRMPLIARWKNTIPAGHVDRESVLAAIDVLPTLGHLAGASTQGLDLDGIDFSDALVGRSIRRTQPVYWEYGRDAVQPGGRILLPPEHLRSPTLAIRRGRWKLLANADSRNVELYDLVVDHREQNNVVSERPVLAEELRKRLMAWKKTLP